MTRMSSVCRTFAAVLGLLVAVAACPSMPAAQIRTVEREPPRFQRNDIWNFSLMASTGGQLGLRMLHADREGLSGYLVVWFPDEDFTGRLNYNGLITPRQAREVLQYVSVGTEELWTGMVFGLTQRLNDSLVGMGGLGLMVSSRYREFAAPGSEITTWVNDDGSRNARFLLDAGLSYITGSGLSFTLGLATFPVDLFIGVGFGSRP